MIKHSKCQTRALIFISDLETDFLRETASLAREGRTTSPVLKEADGGTLEAMGLWLDKLGRKLRGWLE